MERAADVVEPFAVRIERDQLVVVSGEVDIATASELSEALAAVASTGIACVLVDLAAVTFMDSSGLGALVIQQRELDVTGRSLRICAASRIVQSVLQMSGVQHLFLLEA